MKLNVLRADASEAIPFIAERLAAGADTTGGLDSLANMVRGCQCFRVEYQDIPVCYYALDVIDRAAGKEVVIVAAAGELSGVDLTASVLPFIERQCQGAKLLTVHTRRKGLLAKLRAQDWDFGGYVMHKALA